MDTQHNAINLHGAWIAKSIFTHLAQTIAVQAKIITIRHYD